MSPASGLASVIKIRFSKRRLESAKAARFIFL
jgi:hypothetical protein